LGCIKADSETHGSAASCTCDGIATAAGDLPASGGLGKEIEDATELALFEL